MGETGYSPSASALPDAAKFLPFTNPPQLQQSFLPESSSVLVLEHRNRDQVTLDLKTTEPMFSGDVDRHDFNREDGRSSNSVHALRGLRDDADPSVGECEDELSCYRHSAPMMASSHVVGLDDSLEEMEHQNMVPTGKYDANATSGRSQDDFKPWIQSVNDFKFSMDESDEKSSFNQRVPLEGDWREGPFPPSSQQDSLIIQSQSGNSKFLSNPPPALGVIATDSVSDSMLNGSFTFDIRQDHHKAQRPFNIQLRASSHSASMFNERHPLQFPMEGGLPSTNEGTFNERPLPLIAKSISQRSAFTIPSSHPISTGGNERHLSNLPHFSRGDSKAVSNSLPIPSTSVFNQHHHHLPLSKHTNDTILPSESLPPAHHSTVPSIFSEGRLVPQSSKTITSTQEQGHLSTRARCTTGLVQPSVDALPAVSGLFNEGCLAPRSSKAICSQVVRKPRNAPPGSSAVEHKPVKALDLGLDGRSERNVKLQSNDRILASLSAPRNAGGMSWLGGDKESGWITIRALMKSKWGRW